GGVRVRDAVDVAVLRHRRDAGARLRLRVPPRGLHPHHPARPRRVVAGAPAPRRPARRRCPLRVTDSPPDRVQAQAHAKVNLLFRILARETTGYHQIETVFQLLELADDLEVARTDRGVTLDIHGPDLGPVADNLAVRAAQLVLDATGRKFGVAITLTKRIPV